MLLPMDLGGLARLEVRLMAVASKEPQLGAYPEFADLVRKIMDGRSTRAGQIRTGVSHTTIGDMLKGVRPKASTVRQFAEGMGVDADDLLAAAGYPVSLGTRPRNPSRIHEPLRTMGVITVEDLERIPFVDDAEEVAHLYSGIADPRMRERIKELIRTAVEVTDREPPDAGPSGDGTD